MGGEHGLVVLLLVLGDHAEGEARVQQRRALQRAGLQQVEHPAAHLVGVAAGLGRRQQGQARPLGPGVFERVVQRVDLRVHRVPAADVAQQPELLLVADVREVPHQGGHQRRVLRGQVGLVQAVGQAGGAGAGGLQLRGDQLAQERRVGAVGVQHGASSSTAGRRPVRTASSWSSAGQRPRAG
jgi:hypothetical protein